MIPTRTRETWATHTQERVHSRMDFRVHSENEYGTRTITTHRPTPSPTSTPLSQNIEQSTYPTQLTQDTNLVTDGTKQPIQQLITPIQNNIPFGDILTTDKQHNTIRILFKNVNGIYKANSWYELTNLSKQLDNYGVDIFGAAETNLNRTNMKTHQAKNVIHRHSRMTSMHTSSNTEGTTSSYQPGGTMIIVRNKTASRISEPIHDQTGLGRWSGVKLHTNFGHKLNVLTVYQPTKSEGIHTAYQQQAHYFRGKGIPTPDPRKLLLSDLAKLINACNSQKDETIILIDANDNLHSSRSLLPTFLSTTNLTPLLPNPDHYPATHTRGSNCIDFLFGTPRIVEHIRAGGITPFFEAPWPNTDHRDLTPITEASS
jgi:hypothetical protein